MNELIHADIFFFIASIGFCIFIVLGTVLLVYIISTLHSVRNIMKKLEIDVDTIGDEAKEFLLDIQDSPLYRLFVGKKRRPRKLLK